MVVAIVSLLRNGTVQPEGHDSERKGVQRV